MFNYDWFHGSPYFQQREEAKWRCAWFNFSDLSHEELLESEEVAEYRESLLVRTLVYLRDGFSYEVKQIAEVDTKSHLVFECEPVDHQYKVGAFVVTVPFEEIVRVEVFAVHPASKPEDFPQITGFHSTPGATAEPKPESTQHSPHQIARDTNETG